jgi:hypothetical protein
VSGIVRLPVSRQAGFLRDSGDGSSSDTRPGLIEDISGETSGGLAMHGRRDHERKNAANQEN